MATRIPRPGDYFLVRMHGVLGWLIGLGQFLIGDASRYSHAGIVLDDGTAIEAAPFGARRRDLTQLVLSHPEVYFSRLPLTEEQREAVVARAKRMEGRRYSYAAYLAIALARWGFRPVRLRRYIEDSGRIICSAAVDEAYQQCGIHLFDDGRWLHEVTPGDLTYVELGG